jgi:hypothetical protein
MLLALASTSFGIYLNLEHTNIIKKNHLYFFYNILVILIHLHLNPLQATLMVRQQLISDSRLILFKCHLSLPSSVQDLKQYVLLWSSLPLLVKFIHDSSCLLIFIWKPCSYRLACHQNGSHMYPWQHSHWPGSHRRIKWSKILFFLVHILILSLF